MTPRNVLFALVGLVVGLMAAARMPLHAQKPPQEAADSPPTPIGTAATPRTEGKGSLQEALLRPYAFDFGRPTPLEQVARKLSADLGGEVVLDIAALERLDVKKDDPVELELKGSRLKTGLKLLLDQVGMTYRVLAEDNLMILTDKEGSDEPLDRVWTELGHVHRELHDVQDALDELLDRAEGRDDLHLRQPTIIDEMPGVPGAEPSPPGAEPAPTDAPADASPPKRPRTRL
ncbi:hypothetical protein [Paludisphaera mucosa]|uniref:Uncharacterized protein n=1 Tax=Paludisphaera mucosa TaxID=3030827 RepID=A0ABT6FE63_9BACT|nr:hypothetical protein [Paludisphaera mucosa]MDG3005822.1 hypothetical protein [Paludisphaera mucosa]